jgi:hypothetical protein
VLLCSAATALPGPLPCKMPRSTLLRLYRLVA